MSLFKLRFVGRMNTHGERMVGMKENEKLPRCAKCGGKVYPDEGGLNCVNCGFDQKERIYPTVEEPVVIGQGRRTIQERKLEKHINKIEKKYDRVLRYLNLCGLWGFKCEICRAEKACTEYWSFICDDEGRGKRGQVKDWLQNFKEIGVTGI
jgi:ribosomal protein L37E